MCRLMLNKSTNSNLSIRLICKMEGINGDMKNKKKIILIILIILLIIIIGIVVAYKLIENGVINRENFKFKKY